MHSPRSLFGFDCLLFAGREQKHPSQRASDKLAGLATVFAQCQMENGMKNLIVALYISPNQKLDDIINFLHHSLFPYTRGGASLLRNSNNEIPMILSGDFNVTFASDKSLKLVEFLKDKLNLSMKNSPQTSTTRSCTTVDEVFTRSLISVE
ncbi:ATP-dependent DNA helicase [Trichonephila clavipes]|uniref:ATP-dependent DNA helicase n=1 Tax=Trichonephila clavipes TaxID=2585209 RepID=A0A8X7B8L3_TRICX|nr:ATP-dependent DNA helicase [Trichonephila clavipes]